MLYQIVKAWVAARGGKMLYIPKLLLPGILLGKVLNAPKRILIAEDDQILLRTLSDRFVKEGFAVFEVKDGNEAMAEARKNHPDLLLLDILMPQLSGLQAMRQIREEGEWGKNVPIILLTNLDTTDDIIKDIVQCKPAFYLVKSQWKLEDVIKKVKDLLGPAPAIAHRY